MDNRERKKEEMNLKCSRILLDCSNSSTMYSSTHTKGNLADESNIIDIQQIIVSPKTCRYGIANNSGILFDFLCGNDDPLKVQTAPEAVLSIMDSIVMEYLERKTLYRLREVCRRWYVDLHSMDNLRRIFSEEDHFPTRLRSKLWKFIICGEVPLRFKTPQEFKKVELKLDYIPRSQDRFVVSMDIEIRKDILRTFAKHDRFAKAHPTGLNEARTALYKLLMISLLNAPRPTDYCQGMNYVAAFFLLVHHFNVMEATECFMHFLFTMGYVENFENGFQSVRKECHKLNVYTQWLFPKLTHQLEIHSISLEIVSFSWFLLLFLYEVQARPDLLESLESLWDQFLLRGRSAVFGIAVRILGILEMSLSDGVDLSQEDLIHKLKDAPIVFLTMFKDSKAMLKGSDRFFKLRESNTMPPVFALKDQCLQQSGEESSPADERKRISTLYPLEKRKPFAVPLNNNTEKSPIRMRSYSKSPLKVDHPLVSTLASFGSPMYSRRNKMISPKLLICSSGPVDLIAPEITLGDDTASVIHGCGCWRPRLLNGRYIKRFLKKSAMTKNDHN